MNTILFLLELVDALTMIVCSDEQQAYLNAIQLTIMLVISILNMKSCVELDTNEYVMAD